MSLAIVEYIILKWNDFVEANIKASHYNKVGHSWWNDFVNSEINQMVFSNNPPYEDAGSASQLIALGKSWAYYMGQFLLDKKYALISTITDNGQFIYQNNNPSLD